MRKWIIILLVSAFVTGIMGTYVSLNAAAPGFVTRNGSGLSLDGKPFYFAGTNNYYMHYKSDLMINDVLEDAKAMNLRVLRCWGFADGAAHDGYVMQPSLGVYDESGFTRLDYTIYKAEKEGIKLVIPFVNNWNDFGGMNQYVAWTGAGSHDAFYTNEDCKTAYKNYIKYVLNRRNTYSGIAYKDDPTIMTWQLANEPRCGSDRTGDTLVNWADEMSTYIKSLDSNHLVSTGDEGFFNQPESSDWPYNGSEGVDWVRLSALKNIDYGTVHIYPDSWGKTVDWCSQYLTDHETAGDKIGKPVVLEEYNKLADRDTAIKTWTDIVYNGSMDGSMFWILTGIQDDGSLYPDYDGFRVLYPSTSATLLSEHAIAMNEKSDVIYTPTSTATPAPTPTISPTTTTSATPSVGSISIQYKNENAASYTKEIKPDFLLKNTGSTSLNLNVIKERYWYTNETGRPQVASVTWSNSPSAVNVTFGTLGANTYAEISFATGALAPNASVEVHLTLHADNWSYYTQDNDYSYISTATGFINNDKITGYISDVLNWGIQP